MNTDNPGTTEHPPCEQALANTNSTLQRQTSGAQQEPTPNSNFRRTLHLTVTMLVATVAACSALGSVELDADRLPGAQGWFFWNMGGWTAKIPETDVVSTTDGVLTFHPVSRNGRNVGFAGGYIVRNPFETNAPSYSVCFRARIVDGDGGFSWGRNYLEFTFVPPGGVVSFLTLAEDEVSLGTTVGPTPSEDRRFGLDLSEFHDYQLVAIRGVGAYLLVDGEIAASSATTIINREIDNDFAMVFGVRGGSTSHARDRIELSGFRVTHSGLVSDQPIVSCVAEPLVECGSPATVKVAVADPNGDATQLIWHVNGSAVEVTEIPGSYPLDITRLELPVELPVGTNVVGIEAFDGGPKGVMRETTIIVADVTAPVIVDAAGSLDQLWPPNRRMETVVVDVAAVDDCSSWMWRIHSVTCNESCPTEDIQLLDDHTVNLRASRFGHSTSRVYTIWVEAEDASGNLSNLVPVEVVVPHDRRR